MKYAVIFGFWTMFSLSVSAQAAWQKSVVELIMTDAPFKECHASSIVELSPGKLMAAFFAGSQEGVNDVTIWVAIKENDHWGKPVSVVDGIINDTLRFPCWNPVLFKEKSGRLFLFYKVGPTPASWWGMVMSSDDLGNTWSKAEKLPDGILGPVKNKPVQLTDGTLLSASSSETDGKWRVHMERSADLGKNWQLIPVDYKTIFKVIQPSILFYPGNKLQILCRSDQDRIIQSWSADDGKTWGPLSKTNLPNPNSGIDAVTLKNGLQLLVYNPTTRGKEWFNNRGRLSVAVSKDGVNWKDIARLENSTSAEFSYPAVIQTSDGKVHITYTYDRKNIRHVVLQQL